MNNQHEEKKRKKSSLYNSIDGIELDNDNQEFNYAFDFIQHTNRPIIYLTGKAGTGKTTFLKYLRATTDKKLVVLAPTGVAAVNAGGQTIHSFFKIDPYSRYIPNDIRLRTKCDLNDSDKSTIYDYFKFNKEKIDIIQKMELLIIDEISMVRCDLLDVIDKLLRAYRKCENVAFGGVQVILIGDTFQLPPINKPAEWALLSPYYSSPFFFNSKVIEDNQPIYIELKKIYRQSEQDFIDLLNRVRVNQMSPEDYNMLNNKYDPTFVPSKKDNYIILATTNKVVEAYNTSKLAELRSDLVKYDGVVKGTFPESCMPTDKLLYLKVGAQIMFRKNNLPSYYNGTIGKIISFDANKIKVEIQKDGDKKVINVEKVTWSNVKYSWNESKRRIQEEVIGTFTQFPIKLAWAITVHKSQGLTFDKVIADVGSAFDYGQVYVALSRCTSFNGLVLKSKITSDAIKIDSCVMDFAKKETPVTLITNELKSGKADFYYKQSREAFKKGKYSECIDNFVTAIKYRNDIETGLFKRYFEVSVNRLKSYEKKLTSQLKKERSLIRENKSAQSKLIKEITAKQKLQTKIEEQNDTIKSLLEKISIIENDVKGKEQQIAGLTSEITSKNSQVTIFKSEISTLQSELKYAEHRICFLEEDVKACNTIISSYKVQVDYLERNLEESQKAEQKMQDEMNRKWYRKIFDIF